MSTMQSSGALSLNQNQRVQIVRRSDPLFRLPESGVSLPTEIRLPPATSPKANIVNFASSLGMNMPPSINRAMMIARVGDVLERLGYRQDNGVYVADAPRRLQYSENNTSERVTAIELPENIPGQTFNTRATITEFIRRNNLEDIIPSGSQRHKSDLVRDVRDFLEYQGYTQDAQGSYSKVGGVIVQGGYTLSELLNEAVYRVFLEQTVPESLIITQADLIALNFNLNNFVRKSTFRRWPDWNSFLTDASRTVGARPEVIGLAMLVDGVNGLPNSSLSNITGTSANVRVDQKRERLRNSIKAKVRLVPQEWPKRESFAGNATTVMSIEEAIRGGYRFALPQYNDQIDQLLNMMVVPELHKIFLVELIQLYPDLFFVMRSFSPYSLARILIDLYYTHPPSMVQELYTFAVNFPLSFPEDAEKEERRGRVGSLTRTYVEALYKIYGTRSIEEILSQPVHPLEQYVLAISHMKNPELPALVRGVGMMVPEHLLNTEIRTYVLRWLPNYRDVITRPKDIRPISQTLTRQPGSLEMLIEQLTHYTDQEIVEFFGYTGGFNTRNALINNIYQILTEEGFFVLEQIDTERATNTETLMLTELKDLMRPYLVFGTPFIYRVLELDELIQAWHPDEWGQVRFTGVGRNEVYTSAHVRRLRSMLHRMKQLNPQLTGSVDRLTGYIDTGTIAAMERNTQINRFVNEIRRSSPQIRDIVRTLFYNVFFAGMYMRKWHGPGHTYPLRSISTRGSVNPTPKSLLTLSEIISLLDRLPEVLVNEIRRLPDIDYRRNEVTILSVPIFRIIDQVSQGVQCIRVASRHLVLTGYYYLGVVFNEIIPDFLPDEVEAIA